MDVVRFGLGLRALRRRRRLTQAHLAVRVGRSASAVSRMERGEADRLTVHALEQLAAVLGARIDVRLLWHGEGLERLLDQRHADLVDEVVDLLLRFGWNAATEVSFNVGSERGSIDVLAYHAPYASVLVVEVKSIVPDLQAMLFALDRKARLARTVARERGWDAKTVSRLLVLPEDRTARRRVAAHRMTFGVALPARNVEVRKWLREPKRDMAGLLFLTDRRQPGARHRVGRRRADPTAATRTMPLGDPDDLSPVGRLSRTS